MPTGHGCSAALQGRSLRRTCGGLSSAPRPPSAPNVPPLQLVIVHHLPHRLLQRATVCVPDELGGPVVRPSHQNPPDALGRVGIPADKGAATVMDGVGTPLQSSDDLAIALASDALEWQAQLIVVGEV
jgi:hypothetical protein